MIFSAAAGIFLSIAIVFWIPLPIWCIRIEIWSHACVERLHLCSGHFSVHWRISICEPPELPADDGIESGEGESGRIPRKVVRRFCCPGRNGYDDLFFTISPSHFIFIIREEKRFQDGQRSAKSKTSVQQTERRRSGKDIKPPEGRVRKVYFEFEVACICRAWPVWK